MHQRLEALKLAEELGNVSRVCRERGISPTAAGSWPATRTYGSIHQKLEKDKTSRAIPVEIGNIIPHLFNRKVSKENIFFRNKPCKAFPLIQGEF